LLSNAFKFTTEGSITVTVRLDRVNSRDLIVEVEDTGLGIKKED
jgi:signal transduction histidine kinase